MNVSLTPELEKLVNEKVASGLYNSASEVIREGLRLLEEQDEIRKLRLKELRKDVSHGFERIKRGECTTYSSAKELSDEIKAEGRKKAAQRKNKS